VVGEDQVTLHLYEVSLLKTVDIVMMTKDARHSEEEVDFLATIVLEQTYALIGR